MCILRSLCVYYDLYGPMMKALLSRIQILYLQNDDDDGTTRSKLLINLLNQIEGSIVVVVDVVIL